MVTKDPFVLLETLYLHSRSTWPHDSHLTYFSRYEPAGSSVSCSSLDALRVTGKQGSFYKNKGLARMCPRVGISFSCPSISHSGNRRPVAETLALREAAPGRTGAVFALESVLAGSSLLHGPYHLPAAVLEAKPHIAFWTETGKQKQMQPPRLQPAPQPGEVRRSFPRWVLWVGTLLAAGQLSVHHHGALCSQDPARGRPSQLAALLGAANRLQIIYLRRQILLAWNCGLSGDWFGEANPVQLRFPFCHGRDFR